MQMAEWNDFTPRLAEATRLRTLADQVRPLYKIHDVIQPVAMPPKPVQCAIVGYEWYVAQIKPMQDAKALHALFEAGAKTFSPRELYWVVEHRKKIAKTRPLFPRYVFAGLPVNARGDVDTYKPKLCDGVVDLLRNNGRPISLPDTLIGTLMWEDEKRGLEFVWDRAGQPIPKRLKTPEMTAAMNEILEADPESRMAIFLTHFGHKSKLDLHSLAKCANA
jgi:transcription antitermination factor NusG